MCHLASSTYDSSHFSTLTSTSTSTSTSTRCVIPTDGRVWKCPSVRVSECPSVRVSECPSLTLSSPNMCPVSQLQDLTAPSRTDRLLISPSSASSWSCSFLSLLLLHRLLSFLYFLPHILYLSSHSASPHHQNFLHMGMRIPL